MIFMYLVKSYPRSSDYFSADVSHRAFYKLCTLRKTEWDTSCKYYAPLYFDGDFSISHQLSLIVKFQSSMFTSWESIITLFLQLNLSVKKKKKQKTMTQYLLMQVEQ